jgi:hypothetical protein
VDRLKDYIPLTSQQVSFSEYDEISVSYALFSYALFVHAGMFVALLAFVLATQWKLWPSWFYRSTGVSVHSGLYEGRIGVLTGKRISKEAEPRGEVLDELMAAIKRSKIVREAPPVALSAFVLFMKDQERTGGDDSEGLRIGYQMYLKLPREASDHYDRTSRRLKAEEQKQRALYTSMQKVLACEYEVHLNAGKGEEASTEFVRGSDFRIRPMVDVRKAYESRVTKLKITIQFIQICLRISNTYR